MWKGGGGLVLGGFGSQKCSKKNVFLEKSLRRNAVNSSVFAFCGLLSSLNSLVFTVFRACVFTKHCKYQCFWNPTVKYSISDMLCCQSVANSGVLATLAFLAVAKTS